jgi:hypothetical protein
VLVGVAGEVGILTRRRTLHRGVLVTGAAVAGATALVAAERGALRSAGDLFEFRFGEFSTWYVSKSLIAGQLGWRPFETVRSPAGHQRTSATERSTGPEAIDATGSQSYAGACERPRGQVPAAGGVLAPTARRGGDRFSDAVGTASLMLYFDATGVGINQSCSGLAGRCHLARFR